MNRVTSEEYTRIENTVTNVLKERQAKDRNGDLRIKLRYKLGRL